MGKNGQALRMAKANKVYTFTKEELAVHDHNVRLQYKNRCADELRELNEKQKKDILEARQDLYEKIGEMYQDNFFYGYRYFCCKAIPILITHFQFPTFKGHSNKLTRFLEMMMGEIQCPDKDEVEAICRKTEEEYGLYFGITNKEE